MTAASPAGTPRRGFKKLINDPFDAVDEAIEGFVAAHAGMLAFAEPRVVIRRTPAANKVGLVVGGGSGHEPAFLGYVGSGIADAAACGNIFASPPATVALSAIRAASHGRGVLQAYGNYAGDVMNFGLAVQLAAAEGIEVREIRVTDDVASAPAAEASKRRGIAGMIVVFKIAGAAAEGNMSLAEVERVALKANAATRSMGVALSGCEVPGSGRPTFELPDDEIEIGMGVHGEPGIRRGPVQPADAIAKSLVDAIVADMDGRGSGDVALLVNALGSTATLDQYILYRGARRILEERGFRVVRSFVGEYITSLEMAGASLTVTLLDEELQSLLDAPAKTPALVV
jgi:phosphoenolpyruvate---glycerone phosphotransferase subunit DhaK